MMFYVYAHYRPIDSVPFLIGKGKGKRAWSRAGRSKHWHNIVNRRGYRVEILHDDLDEQFALDLETHHICFFGRKDLQEGPLINLTDGGEGLSGYNPPKSVRLRHSILMKGRTFSREHKQKLKDAHVGMTGKKHSNAAKKKMRRARLLFLKRRKATLTS